MKRKDDNFDSYTGIRGGLVGLSSKADLRKMRQVKEGGRGWDLKMRQISRGVVLIIDSLDSSKYFEHHTVSHVRGKDRREGDRTSA